MKDSVKAYFKTAKDFAHAMKHDSEVFLYARGSEPSVEKFNEAMAKLEQKEKAISFGSGAGAISAVLLSQLKAGDHVLYNQRCYSWARHLFKNHLKRFGIDSTEVADDQFGNIERFVKPNTKMIYCETPTYFFFKDLDLTGLFSVAKSHGIATVVDNTYFGPGNLRHEKYPFDFVLHSTTKIICGDGSSLGGVICTSKKNHQSLFTDGLMALGSVMNAGVARQMLEGLSTYSARTMRIAEEMKPLVKFLTQDSRVRKVHYPWELNANGWSEHVHAKFPVGLLSFELNDDGGSLTEKFCSELKLVKMAVSYGSREALIMPSLIFAAKGADLHFPTSSCRLSIGEQNGEAVASDLKQALDKVF